MSFIERIKRPFRSRKDLDIANPDGWDIISGSLSYTGKTVNEATMLQMASTWTAIRLISETIGTLPLYLYEKTDKGSVHATNHPLYRLLNTQPNKEMTSIDCWESIGVSLCIHNQAYILPNWYGPRIGDFAPIAKKLVKPRMENGAVIYATTINGVTKDLRRGEIIPIKGFGGGGLEGLPVYSTQKNAIGLAAAAEEYGARYFANGARPSGILTIESVLKPEQREQIREKFEMIHSGLENSNRLAVLEAGMKYHQVASSASDAQLMEVRAHQIAEVARIYRIPLRMMMDPVGDTYNNNEQDNIRFLQNALRPYLKRIEKSLETTMLDRKDQGKYEIRFDFTDLLQADSKSRSERYRNMRMVGAMTINEVRREEGLPPLDGCDDPHVPLNMAPADMIREINGQESEGERNEQT